MAEETPFIRRPRCAAGSAENAAKAYEARMSFMPNALKYAQAGTVGLPYAAQQHRHAG